MGFLARTSTVVSSGRVRAQVGADPFAKMYAGYYPPTWGWQFAEAGIQMSPELALTLSAMFKGIYMIANDIATMPCQIFRYLDDEGSKERARNHPLQYVLRWRPNSVQTAKEFWAMMLGHFILRGNAYAEIIPGPRGFADQLVIRHPDRVTPERISDEDAPLRIRYRLDRFGRPPRYLTQDEMFVLRDFSSDPLQGQSRIAYAMRSLSTAITQERFTNTFFRKGATGGMVVTMKGGSGTGQSDDESEARKALHADISNYMAGAENAGGILVVEDDVSVDKLTLDLDKAQLAELKSAGIHDVERWLCLPPGSLGGQDQTHADAAVALNKQEYYTTTLRGILVGMEQAIQRDLILDAESFFAEFNMDALLRADMKTRFECYKMAIESRLMWPSEGRLKENMNPDEELDRLAATDRRPGQAAGGQSQNGAAARIGVRATRIVYETAQRVVRKEVAAVTKLAERHAADPSAFAAAVEAFYAEHVSFVAENLHLRSAAARAYSDQHVALLKTAGIAVCHDWERLEAEELAELALQPAA